MSSTHMPCVQTCVCKECKYGLSSVKGIDLCGLTVFYVLSNNSMAFRYWCNNEHACLCVLMFDTFEQFLCVCAHMFWCMYVFSGVCYWARMACTSEMPLHLFCDVIALVNVSHHA